MAKKDIFEIRLPQVERRLTLWHTPTDLQDDRCRDGALLA